MTTGEMMALIRWSKSAGNEIEEEARAEQVWRHIFPEGLDEKQRESRERTLERVRGMSQDNWEGWPDPKPVPELATPTPSPATPVGVPEKKHEEWQGLIPKDSKAYRRGSNHDGTRREVERMRDLSRGSPFDADEPIYSTPVLRGGKRPISTRRS